MEEVWTWLVNHRGDIEEGVGLALTVATFITGLTRTPVDNSWVSKARALLGRLSLVPHKDAPGSLKLPGSEARGPR